MPAMGREAAPVTDICFGSKAGGHDWQLAIEDAPVLIGELEEKQSSACFRISAGTATSQQSENPSLLGHYPVNRASNVARLGG